MEFYEHELIKDMTHRCGKKKNCKFAQRVTSVTNGWLSPWPLLPRRPLQKKADHGPAANEGIRAVEFAYTSV